MKRLAIYLFLAAVFGAYAPVSAQTPDTTSAWRYFPLEVGNVWEYTFSIRACDGGTCDTWFGGHERRSVKEEVIIEGQLYALLSVQSYGPTGTPVGTEERYVRFDSSVGHGVERYADGTEGPWPRDIPCPLDSPFDATLNCNEDVQVFTGIGVEFPVSVDGVAETRIAKSFRAPTYRVAHVADLGVRSEGAYPNAWEWSRFNLSYARVGSLEYGEEQFPVANEPASPPPSGAAFSVYPNPARDAATLSIALDRPQRATVAVYDVLGRRVLTETLGAAAEQTHRLDVAALPPGVYTVRLTGEEGAQAKTRFTIQ